MGWLILIAYVVVWLLYGWRLSVTMLDAEIRSDMKSYPGLYTVAKSAEVNRPMCLLAGFSLASFWPIALPARELYNITLRRGAFRTPIEREEAERQELVELRALARKHNLPMPGDER